MKPRLKKQFPDEIREPLGWNGGGANRSGRVVTNIDTQGDVHPDQIWQDVRLRNVKTTPLSEIWEDHHAPGTSLLEETRSIGLLDGHSRQTLLRGSCAACRWFSIGGGGLRTRTAFANGDLWGNDPVCYLTETETEALTTTAETPGPGRRVPSRLWCPSPSEP